MGFKKKFGRFFGFSSKEESEEITQNEGIVVEEASDSAVTTDVEAMESETDEIIEEQGTVIDDINSKGIEEDISDDTSGFVENDPKISESQEETQVEVPVSEKKKGFFTRLKDGLAKTRDSINSKIDSVLKAFKKVDEELFEELEEALIMADVGVDTSLYIISELRKKVKEKKITETEDVKGAIEEIIAELLMENNTSLNMSTTPCVVMVIGVNGVGKTTSIGKMASRFKAEGKKVILGAADTFRAAAIDQLQIWADRSGVDIIKHQEGSDPASVVFDTIAAAKSRGSDVIILDTAGRLHNKKNLMDELAKISRIIDRELPGAAVETLLVLDATTGQNAVNQAKLFAETSDITGLILTKLDGSAKGGIVLAIAHEQKVPVKLVGVGEGIDDLQDFSAEDFAKALF
ncbi:MAG: signal recognition particle-docking protein FtsY [Clostridia bacterium]|nr:signal recognition particle-docking protein FtsY [Clostridia bacterium]